MSLLIVVTGCGTAPPPSKVASPVLTVYAAHQALGMLPVRLADALGFFRDNHLAIRWVSAPEAMVRIEPAGTIWPIVGYLAVRPDVVLVGPAPDPQFRLRHLTHLPLLIAASVKPSESLIVHVLALHHAVASTPVTIAWPQIERAWARHGLPWVWVTLPEASQLKAIDPHTVVLSWLGASTGPIPTWTVSARNANPLVSRFLNSLNLALWYLHTNSPENIVQCLSGTASVGTIRLALRYAYWPPTTFPDLSTYNRAHTWTSDWRPYSIAVDPLPAYQALAISARY